MMKKSMMLILTICWTSVISTVTAGSIEDGDFLNWSDTSMGYQGSYAYMTRYETGGNPDAHITATTYSGHVCLLMINNDAVWNPSTDGAIYTVMLQIDVKSVSGWGEGQSINALLYQDGQYFAAPWARIITGSSTSWHSMTLGPFQESDFYLKGRCCYGCPQGNPDVHPDFSGVGPPIKFGFSVANSRSGTYIQKYDNWRVDIVPKVLLATVELVPDELDLTPNLPPVKCYIELPRGYSVERIEEVVMCGCREDCIHPLAEPWEVGDYDEDGMPDLLVAFDYLALLRVVDLKRCGIATVEGMVQTGDIGVPFMGQDTVRAKNPGGCICGQVTDGSTDESLEGVLVKVLRDTLVLGWDITKADGRYELSYVVPGVYEVSASKDGYGGAIEEGVESVEAETTVVNLQFSPISVPEREEAKIPETFYLNQNYPNPFNPVTTIKYGLPQASYVRLTLYNISGQRIETLVDEAQGAGYHQVSWSAEDLANGIYFYRIEAGEFSQTRKMLLLR